jgi:hypothetical protein
MTAHARLARWLTGDMRALAKLVDEAPATTLADDEVCSAREHLMESLEAAGRAARAVRTGIDAAGAAELARPEP